MLNFVEERIKTELKAADSLMERIREELSALPDDGNKNAAVAILSNQYDIVEAQWYEWQRVLAVSFPSK